MPGEFDAFVSGQQDSSSGGEFDAFVKQGRKPPTVPGMEQLGALPGVPDARPAELRGPAEPPPAGILDRVKRTSDSVARSMAKAPPAESLAPIPVEGGTTLDQQLAMIDSFVQSDVLGKAKQVATTHSIEALGGAKATDIYDQAIEGGKSLISSVLGETSGQTAAHMPNVAKTAEFATTLLRGIPEAIDFLYTPLGAATAGLQATPAGKAVTAALSTSLAVDAKDAIAKAIQDPTPENLGQATKLVTMAAAPAVAHSRPLYEALLDRAKKRGLKGAEQQIGEALDTVPEETPTGGSPGEPGGGIPETPPEGKGPSGPKIQITNPDGTLSELQLDHVDPKNTNLLDSILEQMESGDTPILDSIVEQPVKRETPILDSMVDQPELTSELPQKVGGTETPILDSIVGEPQDQAGEGGAPQVPESVPQGEPGDFAAFVQQQQSAQPEQTAQHSSPSAPEPAPAAAEDDDETAGDQVKVKTARGTVAQARYRVVEADDLVTSHDTGLNENPNYPQELQPRDRTRKASEAQIQEIAGKLDPEELGANYKASDGAPITAPGNVVISGNGRSIALRRLYDQTHENGEKYRSWLIDNAPAFGLNPDTIESMRKPVLVREMNPQGIDLAAFAKESNEDSKATMSASEQARSDAQRITPAMMDSFDVGEDGDLLAPANRKFVQAFYDQVVGPERGSLMDSAGGVSQAGLSRIRNAVFARAYGGETAMLEKLAESTDSNVKNITTGMVQAAPAFARMRQGIETGDLHPLDLSDEVAEAAEQLAALRREGQSVPDYLRQIGLFGDAMTQEGKALLEMFSQHGRSPKRIGAILKAYAEAVEAAGNPNQASMFAGAPPNKQEVLAAAIIRTEKEFAKNERPQETPGPTLFDPGEPAAGAAPGGGDGESVATEGQGEGPAARGASGVEADEGPAGAAGPVDEAGSGEGDQRRGVAPKKGKNAAAAERRKKLQEATRERLAKKSDRELEHLAEYGKERVRGTAAELLNERRIEGKKERPPITNLETPWWRKPDARGGFYDHYLKEWRGANAPKWKQFPTWEALTSRYEAHLAKPNHEQLTLKDFLDNIASQTGSGVGYGLELPRDERVAQKTGAADFLADESGEIDYARIAEVVTSAQTDWRKTFNPTAMGPQAAKAGLSLREHAAEAAKVYARAEHALSTARKLFAGKDFDTEILPFINAIETGSPQPNPDLQPVADTMRELLDRHRDAVQALGKNKLTQFYVNYFPHIWKQPAKAADVFAQVFGRRPLEGTKAFTKKRKLQSFQEGVDAGLEPVSENPVDLVLLKLKEMQRYILAHRFLNEMRAAGVAKYVPSTGKNNVPPEGWVKIPDSIGTVWRPPLVPVKEALDREMIEGLDGVAQQLGIKAERRTAMKRGQWGLAIHPGDRVLTRFGGPESVFIHEIGHILDYRYGLAQQLNAPPYRAELDALADLRLDGTEPAWFERYVKKPEEQVANMVAAYVHTRARMQRIAPHVFAWFDDFVRQHSEIAALRGLEYGMQLKPQQNELHVGGFIQMGSYYMPVGAAKIIENYLSPGLGAKPWYKVVRGISNSMLQFALGFSAFHVAFTTMDAAVSRLSIAMQYAADGQMKQALKHAGLASTVLGAPIAGVWKGHKIAKAYLDEALADPELAKYVDALTAAGGRIQMDQQYRTGFRQRFMDAARNKDIPAAVANGLLAVPELFSAPIMEWLVPRQKLGVFAEMADFELSKLGPGASRNQVRAAMAGAWDSVDNRMGQLVYDNLFWDRSKKDLAMVMVQSLGWNLGTFREIGGGAIDTAKLVKDVGGRIGGGRRGGGGGGGNGGGGGTTSGPQFTRRMAYVLSLIALTFWVGAIALYLSGAFDKEETRPKHWKDYFFPVIGGMRWSLPGYLQDIVHWSQEPVQAARNKLNPLVRVTAEMLWDEDFYGVEIWNHRDSLPKKVELAALHVAKTFIPFGVRGAIETSKAGGGAGETAAPFFGLRKAPKYIDRSEADLRLAELAGEHRSRGAQSREQAERTRTKRQITDLARKKDPKAGEVAREALRSGVLTLKDLRAAAVAAEKDPLLSRFKGLSAADALDVYELGEEAERRKMLPILLGKVARLKDKPKAEVEGIRNHYGSVLNLMRADIARWKKTP